MFTGACISLMLKLSDVLSPKLSGFVWFYISIAYKGIVHPKMKILSSFAHLKYFQTCMNVFVLLNTKEDILKNVRNRAVLGLH